VPERPDVTLRSLALSTYLPSILFGTGTGAVAPAIAIAARAQGASLSEAGLAVAMLAAGQVCGDVPAGALAARVGEKRAMLLAVLASAVALGSCALATSVVVLFVAVFVLGLGNSVFGLARQTFLSEAAPAHLRARALSTLGGTARIGMFLGPFSAAPLVARWGTDAAFVLALAVALTAGAVLLVVVDPQGPQSRARTAAVGTATVLRENARVLATLGTSGILIGAVRASRQVVVPLWADHLGLDAATTSVIYGLSGVVDMLLFYPAGKVMDVRGRAWVAVPSMAVLGVALLAVPLTTGTASLVAVALLLGFGNGMGAGVVLTLAADVAPERGRAEFFGIWRIFHDAGSAAGPLLISATVALSALAPAIVVMGGLALGSSALLAVWIPRYVPRRGTVAEAAEEPTKR
jgi:MFS family permease